MNKYIIAILIFLSGCATTIPDAVLPPKEVTIHLDSAVFEPCESLEGLPELASWEDVITVTVHNFEKYAICAKKQMISIKLLKEFSNYKGVVK
jgi:hypothetical protein